MVKPVLIGVVAGTALGIVLLVLFGSVEDNLVAW
jgi:hypothetical protein